MSEEPPVGRPDYKMPIKKVRAGEIIEIVPTGCYVMESNRDAVLRIVEMEMIARYQPKAGDFWVVYSDGYQSIIPRQTFLDEYGQESGG